MTDKPVRSQQALSARPPLFSALPISLVATVVCVIVQLHMAVTFADETPAESEVTQGLELFDPSEQNRFTGRLFSASKNYPLMTMRQRCEAYTGLDTAQVECQQLEASQGYVCDYKCSKHWVAR